MQFRCPPTTKRFSVLPFVAAGLVPAALVLVIVSMSLRRAEEMSRLPPSLALVPAARESPVISVRLSRLGNLAIAGEPIAAAAHAAAWQRERAALRILDCEPSRATVVLRAESDAPMALVQRVIDEAQAAGFSTVRLKSAE